MVINNIPDVHKVGDPTNEQDLQSMPYGYHNKYNHNKQTSHSMFPWDNPDGRDFHADITISLLEIKDAGVPYWEESSSAFDGPDLIPAWLNLAERVLNGDKEKTDPGYIVPTQEQITEIKDTYVQMIKDRFDEWFAFRELCTPVVREWIFYLTKHMHTNISWLLFMMGRQNPSGIPIDPFQTKVGNNTVHEIDERQIHSETPQSQVRGDQSYLDNSNDHQLYEKTNSKSNVSDELTQYLLFLESYINPMEAFFSRFEIIFCPLLSATSL